MSLPKSLKETFSPAEIHFITENQLITILPRYSMNGINLITTKLPKIRAMNRIQVPVWLAQILKAQRKCNIVPPEWLDLKALKDLYQFEVNNLESFSELPFNWLELSKIFFENAPDDLADEVHKLKSLIQDLKEIRMIKIKKGLTLVNESHLQLDNLSLMEINEIRPFVVSVMGKLTSMSEAVTQGGEEDDEEVESEEDDASMYGYQKE